MCLVTAKFYLEVKVQNGHPAKNCKGSWEKMSFNYLFMIIDFTHDLTREEIHACEMMVVTRISVEINSS